MLQTITAFDRKFKFWNSQIKLNDLIHFSTLAAYKPQCRFHDLRKNEKNLKIFSTSVSLDIKKVPFNLQLH